MLNLGPIICDLSNMERKPQPRANHSKFSKGEGLTMTDSSTNHTKHNTSMNTTKGGLKLNRIPI